METVPSQDSTSHALIFSLTYSLPAWDTKLKQSDRLAQSSSKAWFPQYTNAAFLSQMLQILLDSGIQTLNQT